MFVLTDACTAIIPVKDMDILKRILYTDFSTKATNVIIETFATRSNFIYFKYSQYYVHVYKSENIINIECTTKKGLIAELDKYNDGIYYLIDIGSKGIYSYQILPHSFVPISGRAATFLRNHIIDTILKDL